MHDQTAAPRPGDAPGLYERGVAAFHDGNIQAALGLIAQACAQSEAPGLYYRNYAEILYRCGRADDAESAARRAVRREPTFAQAWQTLGTILAERGALVESRDCYAMALGIDPGLVQAHNNLAVVLQKLGERKAAEIHYLEGLRLAPGNLDALLNFSALLGELGRYREACGIVERVLERSPKSVRALLIAAEIEREKGRYAVALDRVEQALAIVPDDSMILTRRARLLGRLGRCEAALADCDRVLGIAHSDAEALHAKALALQELDRPAAAIKAFRDAETASVMPAPIMTDRAWMLAELGRKDEALSVLADALALAPDFAPAWYYRASLSRYKPGARDLTVMADLADKPDAPYRTRLCLSFALGKAHLDIGDGERAFARLNEANQLYRATIDYDPDADARRVADIMTAFSADALAPGHDARQPPDQPIFVFGMPRSGTTLVEQILASHPLVHSLGEPTYLRDIAEAQNFPAGALGLAPAEQAALGRRYLDRTEAAEGFRTLDKMPSNFLHAGLIALILPGARMIHCRRDPLDTCLSCYSLLFANGQEFSYDLGELGRYYRLYRALMAHWLRVLPPHSMIEIDYEALVRNTESQVRKILEFCRLPWNPACLRFYEVERRVTSASLVQVRSPVYAGSIGRAQPFRPWLGALEAALTGD